MPRKLLRGGRPTVDCRRLHGKKMERRRRVIVGRLAAVVHDPKGRSRVRGCSSRTRPERWILSGRSLCCFVMYVDNAAVCATRPFVFDDVARFAPVEFAVGSPRVGTVSVGSKLGEKRELATWCAPLISPPWCVHPVLFCLPPRPQLALDTVAISSFVKASTHAEPCGHGVPLISTAPLITVTGPNEKSFLSESIKNRTQGCCW